MKYEGEITEIDLLARLLDLASERFTGAIRFENDAIIKIIYFKEGEVLSASTNDRADSIDEILLRSNKVSRDHIKQALAKRKETETLGDALLNLGFITRKELTWARRAQVIGIIRSLLGWDQGTFTIVGDYIPKREEGTSFPLPQLIVEVIVTSQDRSAVEAAMDGGEIVFTVNPGGDERYRQLGLNEDADAILAAIDGTRSASELASMSTMDTFSVYKLLQALQVLEIIRPVRSTTLIVPPPLEPKVPLDVSFDDEPLLPPVEMPGWDAPPVLENVPPAATIESPAPLAAEPQFKRGATVEQRIDPKPRATPMQPSKARSKVPLIAAIVLLFVAGGGYAAYLLFMKEPAEAASPTVRPTAVKRPVPAPPATDTTPTLQPPVATSTEPSTAGAPPTAAVQAAPSLPAAVTPTPAATAASSDPVRARYLAQAREYAAESASAQFALQVAFVCETSSLATAIQRGGAEIWYVPATLKGRDCFRVMWGRFNDRPSANRAVSGVPPALRASAKPVVVKVSQVVQ